MIYDNTFTFESEFVEATSEMVTGSFIVDTQKEEEWLENVQLSQSCD